MQEAVELPAKGIGDHVAQGIIDQLKARGTDAHTTGGEFVDAVFDGAIEASESHSPSRRAMREIALPIAQGVIIGLDDMESDLWQAMADIVDSGF